VTPLVSDVKFFWEERSVRSWSSRCSAAPFWTSAEPTELERARANVAFVPLGTPLLAGPGAIVATMLFVQRIGSVGGGVAFGAAIVAVVVVLRLAMRFCGVILKLLRGSGVELLTRIAGLLLSAIAVQLIVNAVRAMIKNGPG
jgi:multiple antibiotic resistance protein